MLVEVRLFAGLRERARADTLELELPEGACVADALERLRAVTDGVPVVMAVNREYARPQSPLHAGDEVALIPPVSGGSVAAWHVRVTDQPLALEPLLEQVRDPRAGAIVSFSGVTRQVAELDYESLTLAQLRARLSSLRVDGGMVVNELLMQFQADILNREVVRPVIQETTALVAAYAAGLGVGFFLGLDELRTNWAVDQTWTPHFAEAEREELYKQWKKAVTRSFDWVES